jgi:hypothetical protein
MYPFCWGYVTAASGYAALKGEEYNIWKSCLFGGYTVHVVLVSYRLLEILKSPDG